MTRITVGMDDTDKPLEERVLDTMNEQPIEWTIAQMAKKLNVTSSAVSGIMKAFALTGTIVKTAKAGKGFLYVIESHAKRFQRYKETDK